MSRPKRNSARSRKVPISAGYAGYTTCEEITGDPYTILAEAVILRAFQDLKSRKKEERLDAEEFLRSEYASMFTDLDLPLLIERYKEEK